MIEKDTDIISLLEQSLSTEYQEKLEKIRKNQKKLPIRRQ